MMPPPFLGSSHLLTLVDRPARAIRKALLPALTALTPVAAPLGNACMMMVNESKCAAGSQESDVLHHSSVETTTQASIT
jgi:hypothetical protein